MNKVEHIWSDDIDLVHIIFTSEATDGLEKIIIIRNFEDFSSEEKVESFDFKDSWIVLKKNFNEKSFILIVPDIVKVKIIAYTD